MYKRKVENINVENECKNSITKERMHTHVISLLLTVHLLSTYPSALDPWALPLDPNSSNNLTMVAL